MELLKWFFSILIKEVFWIISRSSEKRLSIQKFKPTKCANKVKQFDFCSYDFITFQEEIMNLGSLDFYSHFKFPLTKSEPLCKETWFHSWSDEFLSAAGRPQKYLWNVLGPLESVMFYWGFLGFFRFLKRNWIKNCKIHYHFRYLLDSFPKLSHV